MFFYLVVTRDGYHDNNRVDSVLSSLTKEGLKDQIRQYLEKNREEEEHIDDEEWEDMMKGDLLDIYELNCLYTPRLVESEKFSQSLITFDEIPDLDIRKKEMLKKMMGQDEMTKFGDWKETDFPLTVNVQQGEIFGNKIKWDKDSVNDTLDITVQYIDGVNCDFVECVYGNFFGYDDDHGVFTRNQGGISQNEHCMRIVPDLNIRKKELKAKLKKLRAEHEATLKELADMKKEMKEKK